jgi:hypothetical protein
MAALILGYVIYFIRKHNLRLATAIICVSIITIFYNATLIRSYYASAGEAGAYNSYLMSTFSVMNKELGSRHGKPKPIVYIRGDDYTYLSIFLNQGSLRFSLVNDTYADNAQPLLITDKQLVKQIYQGTAPYPYPKVSDINAFYGFEIKNKKASSITEEVHAYLLKEVR